MFFKELTGEDVGRGSFCCGWLAKRLDSEFDSAGYLVEIYLGLASFRRVKMALCHRADFDCIHECSKRKILGFAVPVVLFIGHLL